MNTDSIVRRCALLVPGVEVSSNESSNEPLERDRWVEVRGASQTVRFVLVPGCGDPAWEATIQVCEGPGEIRPVDDIDDVVRVLWVAFGSIVYPAVLWELLEADAEHQRVPKIWDEAAVVLLHERGSIEDAAKFMACQRARFNLHAAIAARDVPFPTELVLEAIAMVTPAHAMHRSWTRPTIKSSDREKIYL